jgi:hypothetical protein
LHGKGIALIVPTEQTQLPAGSEHDSGGKLAEIGQFLTWPKLQGLDLLGQLGLVRLG